MDVDADKEALFNEVYDGDHVPNFPKGSGVCSATRFMDEPFTVSIGCVVTNKQHERPRYTAVYEIDSPEVLLSPQWAKQAELGRWPGEVRPYTRNRQHALYK